MCRTENVVYKETWMQPNMWYIGKCQNPSKGTTSTHITGLKKTLIYSKHSKNWELPQQIRQQIGNKNEAPKNLMQRKLQKPH